MNEDGERKDDRKQLSQEDFQPQGKSNFELGAMGLFDDMVPDRCVPLLHTPDFYNNFSALRISASSGKKTVQAIGNDFRLPVLMQQRQISFHGHRNLSEIDPDPITMARRFFTIVFPAAAGIR
jgi:hypothetical protein